MLTKKLIIFAAFKNEVKDLLNLIRLKNFIKDDETIIYDGEINGKDIIICITGIGKLNAIKSVNKILELINIKNKNLLQINNKTQTQIQAQTQDQFKYQDHSCNQSQNHNQNQIFYNNQNQKQNKNQNYNQNEDQSQSQIKNLAQIQSQSKIQNLAQIQNDNKDNVVFLIQGISGALVENLKIGNLVFYDSILNLENLSQISNVYNIYNKVENPSENYDKFNKIWGTPIKNNLNSKNNLDVKNQNDLKNYFNALNSKKIEVITEINDKKYLGFINSIIKSNNSADIKSNNYVDIKSNNYADKNLAANPINLNNETYKISTVCAGLVPNIIRSYEDKINLNKLFGIDVIDMESFYIADIALKNNIPVVCIKSISDDLFENIHEYFSGSPIPKTKKSKLVGRLKKIFKLIKIIFIPSELKSFLKTLKNINIACKNLNNFVIEIVLPYFGYNNISNLSKFSNTF